MSVYLGAVIFGLGGLIGMAALGFAHSHGGHHGAHHAAGGFSHELIALASPRVFFSLALGFGLVGMLAAPLGPLARLLFAALGGLAFERFLVRPYWNFLLRFASRPALSLESAVMTRARAVTDFDRDGSGLIILEYEGEVRQLLATLTREERARHLWVRRGERVRIESVSAAGTCVVSKLEA